MTRPYAKDAEQAMQTTHIEGRLMTDVIAVVCESKPCQRTELYFGKNTRLAAVYFHGLGWRKVKDKLLCKKCC